MTKLAVLFLNYASLQEFHVNRKESKNEQFNGQLLPLIKEAYEEKNGILGYRQMTIKLNRENDFHVNQKRIYKLMQILGLKSVCRRKRKNYIKSTPQVTAENVLNREFSAENFGEKWLTDVTEMKYGVSSKAYLSAILDLGDKSIVSFVIGQSNNNALVFETFDIAHEQHPDAKPIFHSDRGYQYTSKAFMLSGKLAEAPSVRLDEPFNPVERKNIHISGCCCGRLFKGQRPPCRLHGGL